MSDFLLDCTVIADTDPYTNGSLTTVTGGVKIQSGLMKSRVNGGQGGVLISATPTNTTMVSEFKLGGTLAGDKCIALMVNASGNGFAMVANNSELRLATVTAFVPGSAITFDSPGTANNDILRLRKTPTALEIYKNGSLISTTPDTTTGLKPGYLSSWENNNAPGAQYISFDYLSAATATVTLPTPVRVGQTGNVATTTNMAAVTSLTNATITATGTNTFTYTQNAWQNGVAYVAVGTGISQTAGDGTTTAIGTTTIQPPTGMTTVNLASPIDTGAYALGKDPAFVNGVQVTLPTSAGTLNTNSTLTDYVFGTYAGWMRDLDGKMYSFTLNVTESGATVSGGKVSTRYIGSRKITTPKITKNHLR